MPTKVPTDITDLLATGLQAVGIHDIQILPPVGTANNNGKVPTGTRREWRIRKSTGELRGVAYRERNKGRKTVGWINHDSPGFEAILEEFEGWRRAGKYPVGTSVVSSVDSDRS